MDIRYPCQYFVAKYLRLTNTCEGQVLKAKQGLTYRNSISVFCPKCDWLVMLIIVCLKINRNT